MIREIENLKEDFFGFLYIWKWGLMDRISRLQMFIIVGFQRRLERQKLWSIRKIGSFV